MTRTRPSPAPRSAPRRIAGLAAPLVALAALAACEPDPEETGPLSEESQDRIIGSEPVEDNEPGRSPDGINDPGQERPPLTNRAGPDGKEDDPSEVEIK